MNLSPSRRFGVGLAFAVVIGMALRLDLIIRSGWRMDYDEAMIGLLGLRVMRGEFMAFIPAQPALGALEPYLLAPFFLVFGATPTTFRLLSLTLAGAYVVTTGLVGRAAYGTRAGGVAALLSAVAPPTMMIASLKTWGATIETIILGNLLLLTIHHAIERESEGRNMLVLAGLIAGMMFWIAWLGFYYFVPAGVLLLWRGRTSLEHGWWMGILGFAFGSLPFWVFNLTHDFATFRAVLGGGVLVSEEILAILIHAWEDLLPRLISGDPSWHVVGPRGLAVLLALYYGGLLGLLVGVWVKRKSGASGSHIRWMLAIFTLALPLIYLFSGYGRSALNPWGLDATGRYVIMLHSALPVGIGALCTTLSQWRYKPGQLIAPVAALMALGLNLLGLARLDPLQAFDSPYYDRLPASLDALITHLDRHGISHVWTDIGLAQVLTFQSGERILAADYYDAYLAGGLVRFPDILAAVESAERVAIVVPLAPGQENPPLEQALNSAGVSYLYTRLSSTLAVYIPESRVEMERIAPGLGYQY